MLQTRHSGERRNPTEGIARPVNSTNWTPAFAGVTEISVAP